MKRLPNYPGCYVCGDANPRGLDIRLHRDADAVVARFVPGVDHTGYRGRAHGGVLTSLLDEAMAWAPCIRTGRFCVAAEIRIRFVRPAPIGAMLVVRAEMTTDRGRLYETRGEILDENGSVIARGTGKYVPMSVEETAAVLASLTADGRPATVADVLDNSI